MRGRRVRRLEVLRAREYEANGTLQRERRAGCERLDEGELATERAAQRLCDYPDPLEREVECARKLVSRDERALRARRDDERPRRLEPGRADLRLDVGLVDPRRSECPFDGRRASGEGRGDVAVLTRDAIENVRRELLLRIVGLAVVHACVDRLEIASFVVGLFDDACKCGTGLHRRFDVDDSLERLVVDHESLGSVLGRRFGLGDDECHGLPCEDDFLAGERLRGPVGAGRRDRKVRKRGERQRRRSSRAPPPCRPCGCARAPLLRVPGGRARDRGRSRLLRIASRRSPCRARRRVVARRRSACRSSILLCARREPLRARARRRPLQAHDGTRWMRSGHRRSRSLRGRRGCSELTGGTASLRCQ